MKPVTGQWSNSDPVVDQWTYRQERPVPDSARYVESLMHGCIRCGMHGEYRRMLGWFDE